MHIELSNVFEPAGISCTSFIITSIDISIDMEAYITKEIRSKTRSIDSLKDQDLT
jgi:hypothetical protein